MHMKQIIFNEIFKLPVQLGDDPLHLPLELEPSPPHVLVVSPLNAKPREQVNVATVPKTWGEAVSMEKLTCPLVGGVKVEQDIAACEQLEILSHIR